MKDPHPGPLQIGERQKQKSFPTIHAPLPPLPHHTWSRACRVSWPSRASTLASLQSEHGAVKGALPVKVVLVHPLGRAQKFLLAARERALAQALRVPLFIHCPALIPKPVVVPEVVANLDIPSTMLDAVGAPDGFM